MTRDEADAVTRSVTGRSLDSFVPNGRKPGRPPDPLRAHTRAFMPEMSERNFARYWAAHQLIYELAGKDEVLAGIRHAARPNGSVNTAAFERYADQVLIRYLEGTEQ